MLYFVAGLIFVSGASVAVYTVLWMGMLGPALGGSADAAAPVLAATMASLAVGGILAGRLVGRARRPLKVFGALQIAAGIVGALLPLAAPIAWGLYAGLVSSSDGAGIGSQVVKTIVALSLVLVPGGLLGAALPVLCRHEARSPVALSRITGLLGASSMAGAAAGLVLCVFCFIPSIGLAGSIALAAVVNIATGVAALLVESRRTPTGAPRVLDGADAEPGKVAVRVISSGPSDETQTDLEAVGGPGIDEERPTEAGLESVSDGDAASERTDDEVEAQQSATQTDAAVVDGDMVSGYSAAATVAAVSLGAFSVMLAATSFARVMGLSAGAVAESYCLAACAVLLAAALGGAISAVRSVRADDPVGALALVHLGMALGLFLLISGGAAAPLAFAHLAGAIAGDSKALYLSELGLAFAMVLVPSALFGASIPLALKAYSRAETHPARTAGDISFAVRVGLFAGALGAAAAMGPSLGLSGAMAVAGWVVMGCGVVSMLMSPERADGRYAAASLLLMVAGILAFSYRPEWNERVLGGGGALASPGGPARGELVFAGSGRSSSVSVERSQRGTVLRVDGGVEATDLEDLGAQIALAQLPLILHGSARDVLLLGMGSGITAGSVLRDEGVELTVVEPRPEVLMAARWFSKDSGIEFLAGEARGPGIDVVVSGERLFLEAAAPRYDVILCRKARPWSVGEGDMLTTESFKAVRRRLRPEGVFCLSLKVDRLTVEGFGRIVAAFVGTQYEAGFKHPSLWEAVPGSEYILVGQMPDVTGRSPAGLGLGLIGRRIRRGATAGELSRAGITDEIDLAGMLFAPGYALGEMSRGFAPNADDSPVTASAAGRSIRRQLVLRYNLNGLRSDPMQWCSGLPDDASARVALADRFARIRTSRELSVMARQFLALGDSARWLATMAQAESCDPANYSARLATDSERISASIRAFGKDGAAAGLEELEDLRPRNAAEARAVTMMKARMLAVRARSRMADGMKAAALDDSVRSVELAPRSWELLFERAQLLREAGSYRPAVEAAEAALSQSPGSPDIIAFKAECYRAAGDLENAAGILDEHSGAWPRNVPMLLARGRLAMDRGDTEGAAAEFEKAVVCSGGSADIRVLRGKALFELGDVARASVDFTGAVAFMPADAGLRLDLANSFYRLGVFKLRAGAKAAGAEDLARARMHCVAAIDLGLKGGQAEMLLAEIALTSGRTAEADIRYRKALELGVEAPEAFVKALEKMLPGGAPGGE